MKLKKLVCLLALVTASMGSCLALESEISIQNCGDFKVLPQEIIQEIIAISPIEIRAVNKTFYFLSSGYKAPGLMGVENPPQEKSDSFAGNPQWSITFDFMKHNIKAVPSAVWYRLVKEVRYLPFDFVPYLKHTQIHTVYINKSFYKTTFKTIEEIILQQKNTKLSKAISIEYKEKTPLNDWAENGHTQLGIIHLNNPHAFRHLRLPQASSDRQDSWFDRTGPKIQAFFRETMRIILSCCSKAPNHELFEDEFDEQT